MVAGVDRAKHRGLDPSHKTPILESLEGPPSTDEPHDPLIEATSLST